MFENSVFKISVDTEKWLKAAFVRAVKTFCQTAVSLITVGSMITELDWMSIIGISCTSFIVSLLTSIAGIPEVQARGDLDDN